MSDKAWVEALDSSVYVEVRGRLSTDGVADVKMSVTGPGAPLDIEPVVLTPDTARRLADVLTDLANQVDDFNTKREEWS